MRQVVLDTETTGLSYESGDRVIEIGCIELVDRKLTGNHFHTYINPERKVDEGAFRVHGLSNRFLEDKPLFKDIVHDFLAFICDAELIIHNASFDLGFLDAELRLMKHPSPIRHYCPSVCDTLILAREKYPGQRNNLDALCKRYHIDNSKRNLHGALLDAEILAFVYLAMTGGQTTLFDEGIEWVTKPIASSTMAKTLTSSSPVIMPTDEELKQHLEFMAFINAKQA